MRLVDAVVLATTKLKTQRVRTGVITGVSGVLFGLLIGVVVIFQGAFDSAERFNKTGLGSRYVVSAGETDSFYMYEYLNDPAVVERVRSAHQELVAKKQAAARKYSINYNPATEDPSPIIFDEAEGRDVISEDYTSSEAAQLVERELAAEHRSSKSDLDRRIDRYSSAVELGQYNALMPESGTLLYMKDGKEESLSGSNKLAYERAGMLFNEGAKYLQLLPESLAEPFISTSAYDPSDGELPVILPYDDAEALLELKPLANNASTEERRNRMQQVHSRVGEVVVEFCYRNEASNHLLSQAMSTADEMEKNKNNLDYQKPSLIYAVPDRQSCGEVAVASDTRTAAQKAIEENFQAYQKEIGAYIGDPEQQKLTLRAVGVSAGNIGINQQFSVSSLVQMLLSSSLGHGVWNIPLGLLEQTPESARPAAIFNHNQSVSALYGTSTTTLYEFDDPAEARDLVVNNDPEHRFWAYPFGSSSLIINEAKAWFERIIFWVVVVIGVVATIILSGLVGRTIADSRRETAVFRSIGATRGNIASIYTVYTLLFSVRVAIFAFVLGLALALIANLVWSASSTIGAELAFGVVDSGLTFSLVGLGSVYLPVIAGAIIAVGLASVSIPILRNVRRNPINDMRDE